MPIGAINSIQSDVFGSMLARVVGENSLLLQKSLTRLSTGLRITSAGDDPAQIGTAVRFGNQIARIGAAQSTITNAKSFSESQSGYLDQVADALDRMSELAVLAKDTTITADERAGYQAEFVDLQNFVSDVGTKKFNSVELFGTSNLNVVVDEEGGTFTLETLEFRDEGADGGLATAYDPADINLNSDANATTALTKIEEAIDNLGGMQAKVGGNINRLEFEFEGLSTFAENLQSAHDNIMAVDVASESVELSRRELLTQSGVQTLASWNTLRTNLLRLFQ